MLSYFVICMIIFIGIFPMIWEVSRGRFDFFNLKNPFIIYYLLQLPISGLVTLLTGHPSEIGLDPFSYSQIYEEVFALSFIGLFLFQLGYYTQSARAIKIPVLLRRPWIGNRYRWIVAMFLTLGIGAFLMLLVVNGGLAEFLTNREKFRAGGLVGQGVMIFPATVLMALAALIYFLGNVQSSATRRGIVKSISVLMIALVPAFIMGFRSAIFIPVLQFMVCWHYGYRKIQTEKLIVPLVLIVVAFTVYGVSREIPQDVTISPTLLVDAVVQNPELGYAVVSRSKGTEVVASVINKLDQTGDYDLNWGSLFEAATIMIPRSLWEDKPQASSVRFTTYFFSRDLQFSRGYDLDAWGGISPTIVGELYWHFGWVGVLIGLYFLGRLAKVAYSTLQRNRTSSSAIIIYAIFYTSFAMFSEALQGYINGLVMSGFAIVIALLMLTMRNYPKLRESA